jgi:hypothetical protein
VKPATVLSLLLACSLAFTACDIFQTRDPEPPTQSTSGRKPPDTPEIVLENFKTAIQEHNGDDYMRCFVDTTRAGAPPFVFSASGDFAGLFRSWQLEDERRYFQNLGAPVAGVPYLSFSNLQQINRGSASTEFTMEYLLFYPHRQASIPRELKGYMHLYLQTDGQHGWSISRWDDARTVTDSTWSYLKAHF